MNIYDYYMGVFLGTFMVVGIFGFGVAVGYSICEFIYKKRKYNDE